MIEGLPSTTADATNPPYNRESIASIVSLYNGNAMTVNSIKSQQIDANKLTLTNEISSDYVTTNSIKGKETKI